MLNCSPLIPPPLSHMELRLSSRQAVTRRSPGAHHSYIGNRRAVLLIDINGNVSVKRIEQRCTTHPSELRQEQLTKAWLFNTLPWRAWPLLFWNLFWYRSIVELWSHKGNWSLSQLSLGKRQLTLWTSDLQIQTTIRTDRQLCNDETVLNIQILNQSCSISPAYKYDIYSIIPIEFLLLIPPFTAKSNSKTALCQIG